MWYLTGAIRFEFMVLYDIHYVCVKKCAAQAIELTDFMHIDNSIICIQPFVSLSPLSLSSADRCYKYNKYTLCCILHLIWVVYSFRTNWAGNATNQQEERTQQHMVINRAITSLTLPHKTYKTIHNPIAATAFTAAANAASTTTIHRFNFQTWIQTTSLTTCNQRKEITEYSIRIHYFWSSNSNIA